MTRVVSKAGVLAGTVSLFLGLGVAVSSSPANAAGTGCSTGTLPSVVQGSPNVKAGQATGVYLWHDSSGFHLRVTHPGTKKLVATGRLDATSFRGVKAVALEHADTITRSGDGKTLSFRFTNYGKIDGMDFSANCSKTMRVVLGINGTRATTRQVKLGAHRTSPTSVPFRIERTAPKPAAS